MTVRTLHDQPPPELAQTLETFEARFTYPLGPGRSFRISHGDDYPRFFRAMGDARCFVAERNGQVNGVLCVAVRAITLPDGSQRQAAYIGDLKTDPQSPGSFVLLRLAQTAIAWARPQVTVAYGVVMDGTRAEPTNYTGRIGIPGFRKVGNIIVLRFAAAIEPDDRCHVCSKEEGEERHRTLGRGRYFAEGGNPAERSEIDPFWIVRAQGLACGRVEDTRRAKRLIDSDGVEMQSAHLACFAWQTPQAAAELIHSARGHAARLGFPALFVSVPERDMPALDPALGGIDKTIAPATIYGAGLPAGGDWNINTSEI
jgi:hypothetical protein